MDSARTSLPGSCELPNGFPRGITLSGRDVIGAGLSTSSVPPCFFLVPVCPQAPSVVRCTFFRGLFHLDVELLRWTEV